MFWTLILSWLFFWLNDFDFPKNTPIFWGWVGVIFDNLVGGGIFCYHPLLMFTFSLTWLILIWLDMTWLDMIWLDLTWLDLTLLGLTRLFCLTFIFLNTSLFCNVEIWLDFDYVCAFDFDFHFAMTPIMTSLDNFYRLLVILIPTLNLILFLTFTFTL